MRVLHVMDSLGVYGKERVILELMEQQARNGLEPILGSITRSTEAASCKPILRAAQLTGANPAAGLGGRAEGGERA